MGPQGCSREGVESRGMCDWLAGAGEPLAGAAACASQQKQAAAAAASAASEAGAPANPLQALLGVVRAAAPDNLVRYCPYERSISKRSNEISSLLQPCKGWRSLADLATCLGQVKAAADMNVLGVITASLFFGVCLASLGPAADGWVAGVGVFNAVIAKMVAAVLWVTPLGVASLIAAAIVRSCTLAGIATALGLWAGTVLVRVLAQFCFRTWTGC